MGSLGYKSASAEEVIACQAAIFEWAESFDTKDWNKLAEIVAPTLYVDYRAVMGMLWESMPAAQFIDMASNAKFLGNPRIKTQHFIGAGRWIKTGEDEITGYHQMRVAHQKYKDDELSEVLYKGHAHGKATVQYRRIGGVWKFAGLEPNIRWAEHDYDKIFHED
ncbi:scytalone dehydratase [Cladophialophora yegresii CBS 114405]|uniref:Scytalone dehydratase n=1 Tax=Cladophialophora yegresii CBS 114405 TaxID=1182544 RepID=W9WAF3_9EURO|nr:scytalone dehydratase [Cladophialophora yegresii CBS 114405]EXJ61965.1 scytalone dehydratase [Cladophialophora yegresii CBS 114405]